MADKGIYKRLSDKLGVWESERFPKVLAATITPEEAAICLELFEPATCKELAARMGIDEKALSGKLDVLVDKGMLTRGLTQYAFHTTLLAFHHDCVADTAPHTGPYAISQEAKELWADFFYNEWADHFLKHTEEFIKMTGRSLPIWPAIGALERSPDIKPEDILPEENFKLRIENAKSRILAPCGCRVSWGYKCKKPLMVCFACFDRPRGEYYLNQPGRLLKEVTLEEALATARQAEEAGLVHWGDCYCCDCCCENLYAVTRDKRYDLMTPNRFLAVVNEETCTGCEKCIERCPFEAVEMKPVETSSRQISFVDPEKCKGCGLCVITCEPNALTLKIVRPPEYLKPKPPEGDESGQPVHVIPVWGHYFLK
ncbi:MAG: 4Fe-4S binding protein [Acidobacteria bacterium]|nr:4Fe-4S binding protein [Acidobacteriota bacterium]